MTAAIVLIQQKIRRALQLPLYDATVAAGIVSADNEPYIQWKGIPFERDPLVAGVRVNIENYLAVEFSMSDVVIHEVGRNPMVEAKGHVTVNCHSPIDQGEDANDALARIVAAAYPYASTPSFEGISVFIDKMVPGGYGSDGPWLTGLVSVDWNIYRRS